MTDTMCLVCLEEQFRRDEELRKEAMRCMERIFAIILHDAIIAPVARYLIDKYKMEES